MVKTSLAHLNTETSRSIDLLSSAVRQLFHNKGECVVIFCDQCDITWPSEKVINIVLFGNALVDSFYFNLLPKSHTYKLWVLCHSFKERLENIIGFPKNYVGVIDRYDIYPILQRPTNYSSIVDSSFVYSARASSLKNFKSAIHFINILGQKYSKKFDLEVYSPLYKKLDYQKYINTCSNVNLILRGDLGVNWIDQIGDIGEKLLIQPSLDPKDDFNVSTAQWQQVGGRVISSDLGPYKDLYQGSVYHLCSKKLISYYETENIMELHDLVEIFDKDQMEIISPRSCMNPVVMNKSFIISIVSKIDDDLKNKIAKLNTYDLSTFCKKVLLNGK